VLAPKLIYWRTNGGTEITLIEAVATQQVVTEVERNLEEKMPAAIPAVHMLVSRCL
jgi:hypothetical protein